MRAPIAPLVLLTCVLVLLRVGGVIDWPFWAITAPLWLPFAVISGVAMVVVILGAVVIFAIALVSLLIHGRQPLHDTKPSSRKY